MSNIDLCQLMHWIFLLMNFLNFIWYINMQLRWTRGEKRTQLMEILPIVAPALGQNANIMSILAVLF